MRLGPRTSALKTSPPGPSGIGPHLLLGCSSSDIVEQTPRCLDLGFTRRRRTPNGGSILVVRLLRASESGQLGHRVGKLSLRRAKRCLEVEVRRGHRHCKRAPSRLSLGGSGRPFIDEPPPVTLHRLDLGDQSGLTHLRGGGSRPRSIVLVAALALESRPAPQLGRQR